MDGSTFEQTVRALTRERDLYLRLLELNMHERIEPFLADALPLIVETSGAERGYVELYDTDDRGCDPRWWGSHGIPDEEVEDVRKQLSSRIIARSLANGEVVESASAVHDRRFQDLESVRRNDIRAVLCAPIGVRHPVGVLYLQGRVGDTPFGPDDRRRVEAAALHLGPLAGRILERYHERAASDPTRALREKLGVRALVGRSAALAEVLNSIQFAAQVDASVVISGAAGVGKALVARLIHDNSKRSQRPFVAVNCRSQGVEARLFGGSDGAGLIAKADGGTLFLEEISELPASAQTRVLELLENRAYVAGDGSRREVDVRVLTSSSFDLKELLNDNALQSDLYYRIQVLTIRVPALAERVEDISELAQHICGEICEEHRYPRLRLSLGAISALESQEWPGNLDDLRASLEKAAHAAVQQGLSMIERGHLFPERQDPRRGGEATWQAATREFQRSLLEGALSECDWNITETAKRLDVARSHIYNLIKSFKIERGPGA
ncbi:MAG: sigma-54-dependent Fis family transcriptional regulator [Myxococcales bacterium]|nr:sigma-54-dependent Fis family transcriptional regulator [Myxococcales bacterium]